MMSFRRSTLSALALCVALGAASPAIAQTACRWEGTRLRCERNRDSDYRDNRYRRDRDYDDRYRRGRSDRDYYRDRYYNNRGPYNRGAAYDRWRRDRDYDDNYYRRGRYRSSLVNRIDNVYRSVLGRSADSRGLRTYIDRIEDNNWDLSRVRRDLAGSREASTAINRAYREILGRSADRRGLRTYLGRLRDGWSLNRIRQDLANSREARRRY